MRILPLLFLATILAAAQPVITVSAPASVTAGATINLTVSASGTASSGLTAIGFTVTLPASLTLTGTPASNQSGGGIFGECNPATATCFVGGFDQAHGTVNLNAIADGALVTIPVSIAASAAPGTISISLSSLLGASGTLVAGGVAGPVTAGPPASLKILSRCDTNSDGAVNVTDVQAAITAYLNHSACPIAGDTCTPAVITSIVSAALGGACGA